MKHRLLVEKDKGNACRKNQEKKTNSFFLANFFRGLSFYGADRKSVANFGNFWSLG